MLDVSICDLEVFSLDKAFVLTSHCPDLVSLLIIHSTVMHSF